jgi:hypothetical protein
VYNGDIGGMCGGSTSFVVGASYDFDSIDGQLSGSGSPGGSSTGTRAIGKTNNDGAFNNGTFTISPTPCRGDDCPEELQELLDIEPGSVPAPYKLLKKQSQIQKII